MSVGQCCFACARFIACVFTNLDDLQSFVHKSPTRHCQTRAPTIRGLSPERETLATHPGGRIDTCQTQNPGQCTPKLVAISQDIVNSVQYWLQELRWNGVACAARHGYCAVVAYFESLRVSSKTPRDSCLRCLLDHMFLVASDMGCLASHMALMSVGRALILVYHDSGLHYSNNFPYSPVCAGCCLSLFKTYVSMVVILFIDLCSDLHDAFLERVNFQQACICNY